MKILSAFLFSIITVLSAIWSYHRNLIHSAQWTCDVVHEAYYKKSTELNEWREFCRREAGRISIGSRKSDAVANLNRSLSAIETSHLQIYSPQKSEEMWDNRSIDNGLRVRIIDGAFIITEIIEGSPAAQFDLHLGDEIVSINGETPVSPYEMRFLSGEFEFKRLLGTAQKTESETETETETEPEKYENFVAIILAQELTEDMSPVVRKISGAISLLRLKSFLPQYFDKSQWQETSQKFLSSSHVIIDLRGNSGGSFVSMLRALSPFFCVPTSVGLISSQIANGKNQAPVTSHLKDDLESRIQIDQLENEKSLILKTYPEYGCTDAKVTVLVDADSASTAEIFAFAISKRSRSRIWGVPTAGQVVVARWYDLSPLGFGGYSLSIPIAGFASMDGIELEAEGMTPHKLLFYDLESARRGIDNWLQE